MIQQEAQSMADELGLQLKVLTNGFQFKRKNQIVTIYKHKWHYNMGTNGKQWKNFNGDHKQVLRQIFKKPQTTKIDVNVLELSDKGVSACIKHVERKLAKYMDLHPGKVDNELFVMLKNLILEFEQYAYGDIDHDHKKNAINEVKVFSRMLTPKELINAHETGEWPKDGILIIDDPLPAMGSATTKAGREYLDRVLFNRIGKKVDLFKSGYGEEIPKMIPPYCQVGTLVSLNTSFLGQPIGTKCLVYHVDQNGSAAIISDEGVEFGYFNESEIVEYLEFTKHTNLDYNFISVIRLMEDFRQGRFEQYFK